MDRLGRDELLADEILSPDALQKYGFRESDEAIATSVEEENRERLMRELRDRKDEIVAGIKEALARGCNQTSLIDSQYNATKLNLFRTYFRLKGDPDHRIEELEKELTALEAEYTSLVDHGEN